jgi:hypothetical protein
MANTAQAPIKAYQGTKDKLRHAASLSGCTQAELLDQAVGEFLANHRDEFAARLDAARNALLGDPHDAVAFALGVEREQIDAVAGAQRT